MYDGILFAQLKGGPAIKWQPERRTQVLALLRKNGESYPLVKPVSTKASSSTLQKPDLAPRRSFSSKPLSSPRKPAPAATAERSPTTTGPVVRPKPRTERSRSSLSLKAPASSSPRSKVDTTARKPVPVKSSRLATRPATTAVYVKKQPQSNAVPKTLKSKSISADRDSPKKSDSINEIDATKSDHHEVETEYCQDSHDQESVCSSVIDANNEIDNTELSPDLLHDDEQLEQINEDAYLLSEASTVVSEIEQSEAAELENKVNEVTEKLQQDNANNDESRNDAENADDANSKKDGLELEEEKVTNNETTEKNYVAAAEEEEKPEDDNNEKSADREKPVDDNNEKSADREKPVDEKNEKSADKEKEVEKVSGADEQVKSENNDTKKKINTISARWSNKKEASAAPNAVIEEAASKLRVNRKNKVLALVGAFETVMSQD
ncbi:hypothetical protein POM88_036085 [Heracleum sosnowskyi]|uniref:Calmodulin-binding domain-containing protein n=1 Tax=Heracleum sosnowskyi TaxID=360622 RepID=A0AAD8MFA8_9APIA|nr:hypothetical protein POM88_036085 [Heracleum sosnowskyi]